MEKDPTEVSNEFERDARSAIMYYKPLRLLEVGTFLGKGSTLAVLHAIHDMGVRVDLDGNKIRFLTIEAAKHIYVAAHNNLAYYIENGEVELLWGYSLPESRIKSYAQWAVELQKMHPNRSETLEEWERVARRMIRMDVYADAPRDMIGEAYRRVGGSFDFVLIDANGLGGTDEFDYVMELQGDKPCVIALDDTLDTKHRLTVPKIKSNPRFKILAESTARYGHMIVRYE